MWRSHNVRNTARHAQDQYILISADPDVGRLTGLGHVGPGCCRMAQAASVMVAAAWHAAVSPAGPLMIDQNRSLLVLTRLIASTARSRRTTQRSASILPFRFIVPGEVAADADACVDHHRLRDTPGALDLLP